MNDGDYEFFYCPGCSKYKHKSREQLVRVAHLTEPKVRQTSREDALSRMYTCHFTLLCTECVEKGHGKSRGEKPEDGPV